MPILAASSHKNLTPKELEALLDYAEIAQAVYDPTVRGKGNWCRLSDKKLAEMKIDPSFLHDNPESALDSKTGFKAGLFERSNGQIVLAFAGSETPKDWYANFKQSLGGDEQQYRKAAYLSRQVATQCKGDVHITGHSLGGGLAALGSAVTGIPATTFNPAGLHSKTLDRQDIDKQKFIESPQNQHIQNYIVKGEVLDKINGLPITPSTVGVSHNLNSDKAKASNIIQRHKMSVVIDILKEATTLTTLKETEKLTQDTASSKKNALLHTLTTKTAQIKSPERRRAAETLLIRMQNRKANTVSKIEKNPNQKDSDFGLGD